MFVIPPAISRCTDVILTGVATGDLLTRDANGQWVPVTRTALGVSRAVAFFRGSDSVAAGIGTTEALNLAGAAESILLNGSALNAGQIDVPAGTYQYEMTVQFDEGTVASLTDPGTALGPNLTISNGGSWTNAFLRVFPIPDMVTAANYAGGFATVQSTATFAVATTLSLITVVNNMKAAAAVAFNYFLTIKQIG